MPRHCSTSSDRPSDDTLTVDRVTLGVIFGCGGDSLGSIGKFTSGLEYEQISAVKQ